MITLIIIFRVYWNCVILLHEQNYELGHLFLVDAAGAIRVDLGKDLLLLVLCQPQMRISLLLQIQSDLIVLQRTIIIHVVEHPDLLHLGLDPDETGEFALAFSWSVEWMLVLIFHEIILLF